MNSLSITHVVTLSVISHAVLLWLLYIAIRMSTQHRQQRDALAQALRRTPLRYTEWKRGRPHCAGLWLLWFQNADGTFDIEGVHVPHNGAERVVEQVCQGRRYLLSFGPLPRFEDSPDFEEVMKA